ncbi:MAG: UDP-N-acetylmuramoyl-L-alanyl-D-glutamate--2,6-diaminopimelate ligase [Bacteroides sp.]|nr:UDP-N-acetylmuramoyl-L-alanyl-D-glutamate--2,6-diaminopimelate ligase [Bacteroides sp.]
MTLYDICPQARENNISDTEINSVTDNTRVFQKGDVFVCIKGASFDGHTAAKEMEEKGAALIVAERDAGCERQLIVPDTREYYAFLAANYHGNPQNKLKMIAVTGTNGKTTVAHIVQYILNENGKKCACIGTAGCDLCGAFYESDGDVPTTPRQMELFRYLAEAVKNGAEYCSIEASSQALAQGRLFGITFEIGIFTNLTQDHLDVHGTMENYYKAKRSLFKQCKKALVCVDDKYGKRLYRELELDAEHKRSYSIDDAADYYSVNIRTAPSCVSYWFSSAADEKSFPVKFSMPGRFNVANSAAAVGACRELGVDIEGCIGALEDFKGVNGRCEVIWHGDFTVICDYAHTADALEKILSSVKSFAEGRVVCVFGAAGERDADKRADMGVTVGKNSDFAIVTSDNPRFEDPMKIIGQLEKGLDKTMVIYTVIEDRREAVEYALKQARPKDIIVLCGKGHETHQIYGNEYRHFDEHEIVREFFNNRQS